MKALVFNGPRDVRYEDYPDPVLKTPNSAVLKVKSCSICGSDLHIYHGDQIGKTDYEGQVEKFCVGHEFIGEVVETGPDVHTVRVGDRVLSSGGAGCGECGPCLTGNARACKHGTAFGLSNQLNGGQAEYVNIPNADQTLLPIPEGVTDEQAVLMTDAMATASFGINNADISQGGVSSVFEASGVKPAVDSTLKLVRNSGTVSLIGLPQGDTSLPLNRILYKGLTIRAGVAPVPRLWEGLIPLLQHGRLKAEGLFSHHMNLTEGAEAYRLFDSREDGVVKIMIQVDG